ncbi:MAG TPA: biotin carboxylase N-terminal domain-containing protein [Candidatus Baltobacteraceae bacterium]|jgi:3-methylcrotonyl-CoA carboxylase alpha subunit
MIRRLLIANRGEIAVRVARAAREMEIVPLGVYSDADERAFHRRVMNESARIGPPPALESYLNIGAILDAARAMDADSVHPGYGFLAESATFASAVRDAGLVFVGPPTEAIAAMGSKIESKRLVRKNGVPTIPGYDGDDQSSARLRTEAQRIGPPVLIKASAGGGGRGMRIVEDIAQFDEALDAARREAKSAFGDDRVLLEKYLRKPRHIEVQVLADKFGATVHMGERECSIQRRHQKILEEAPSVAIDDALRTRLGQAAIAAARSVGYENAGTVEFLVDEGKFYFLEMNTRIQVEHPVTELAYGVDLIRAQIELASGDGMRPEFKRDLSPRGWAIEVRLYAEDPSTFLPSSGTVTRWIAPEGPGIRVDSGIAPGSEVGVWYDPMLAKIIAWGGSREAAIRRLSCALDELEISGVRTNLPLLQWILRDEAFNAGATSTNFLNERLPEGFDAASEDVDDDDILGAAAAALRDGASWRVGSTGIPLDLSVGGRTVRLRASLIEGDRWKISGDISGEVALGDTNSARYTLAAPPRSDVDVHATGGGDGTVVAPMPGKIVAVAVQEGEEVEERALLVVLEAMKMEHRIEAPVAGTVREIAVAPGALVAAGERLVTIT